MRTRRSFGAIVAAAALVLTIGVAPADAQDPPYSLDGIVACADDGSAVIVWILESTVDAEPTIDGSMITFGDGLPPVMEPLDFDPNPLPSEGESSAVVDIDGTIVGTAEATVSLDDPQIPGELVTGIDLEGCPQPLEPTTTMTPLETTTTVAAEPLVTATPRFTG